VNFWELVFVLSGFLLLHTYVLFNVSLPILVELLKGLRRKREPLAQLPTVSLVISAFNEEDILEQKIQNCLQLDYPKDKLQILIGSDGSKDNTAAILRKYSDRITPHIVEKNRGKAAMLNDLCAMAQGDVLLFSDANTFFFPNVVRKIVQPFADPKLGCVCGHLILTDSGGSALGIGESTYWNIESEIKKFEGMLDIVVGANGALYAIRKALYKPIPVHKSIMDDFYVTVQVLLQGYGSTYLTSALGTEQTSKYGSGEFKRKIRIGRANFNFLFHYLKMLNPAHPLLAYFFFSHKLVRWFSPQLLLLFLCSNVVLLFQSVGLVFYLCIATLVGQLGFYGLAAIAYLFPKVKIPLSGSPYYFISMNVALLLGFFKSFLPESGGGWQRIERG
jgi:cellulose synthase/poly-beta-1,6-N-acetylglucosamine synthase-like glycosyltransferase